MLIVVVSADCSSGVPKDIPIYLRKNAVKATIEAASECRNIPQFYWEIGDADGPLASGRKGFLFNADTRVNLASASKWIFATYLLEKYGSLTNRQIKMLTQRSGYRSFLDQACIFTWTVNECMDVQLPIYGFENPYTSENVGTFFYSGAHFQQLAIDLGLGNYASPRLTDEIQRYIDDDEISYFFPAIGSGMRSSARTFGKLMRRMMRNEYRIGALLGSSRICTLPSMCPASLRSPLETDWDYSLGHWVEHEPGGPDEVFSGPGLQGFYPWISADKSLYGMISTEVFADLKAASSSCGGKMRKAWISGVMVH
jgi:hypothetical protein